VYLMSVEEGCSTERGTCSEHTHAYTHPQFQVDFLYHFVWNKQRIILLYNTATGIVIPRKRKKYAMLYIFQGAICIK
jgi:hypothetical protein